MAARVQVFYQIAVTRDMDLDYYKSTSYPAAAREDVEDIFAGAQTVEEGLGLLSTDDFKITVQRVKVLD